MSDSNDWVFPTVIVIGFAMLLGFIAFGVSDSEANRTARWEACVAKNSAVECAAVLK